MNFNLKCFSRSVILGTTNSSHVGTRIEIESTIHHKDYQSYEDDVVFKGENDIALIKLAKEVQFTKYIQPICMPFTVSDYEPPTNDTNFTIAGWGTRRYTFNNEILEFVEIPFFPFADCEQIYEYYGRDLTDNSICAGGVIGENFCYKDGGGPLMRQIGDQWILEGIITKNIEDGCASKTPGVFINVIKYERWIKEHILYGWETPEKDTDRRRDNNSSDSFMTVISDYKFWILVTMLTLIVTSFISCTLFIKNYWKTHSTCIVATFIITLIVIFILMLTLYVTSYLI